MDAFMRDTDAFSWYMEKDPILRSTVVSVAWLDRSPDWDALVAKLHRAVRRLPMFHQRVLEPPLRLATPRWTFDHDFDPTWHLRRMDAPAPRTPDTVLELARLAAMSDFDRSRPLWEFTLVEHLEDDRAALVMKVHHALTDGLGGMQLALHLFDLDPGAPATPADTDEWGGERIGPGGLVCQSLTRGARRAIGLLTGGVGSATAAAVHGALHPLSTVRAGLVTTSSIIRTVAPVLDTLSPSMTDRGMGRRLDLVEVGLADLKRAAAVAGGSVNDGFMAAVAGGFRLYHDRHRSPVERLRVTLPISLRTPQDPIGGNRITLMRFPVPVADLDAASRIRSMEHVCRAARDERSLPYTNAIATALNLLPRGVVGAMLKHVDFVASDVPGFTTPVYLAGARLERLVAFGPTIGASINLTLVSYNGRCTVGITSDTAAVPDPDVLADCMRAGFEEVLALAGDHAPATLPLRARVDGTPDRPPAEQGSRRV